MAGALLYLRVTSIVGAIKSRVRRLKQPKYMAGALVGIGYFYLTFARRAHAPQYRGGPGASGPRGLPDIPVEMVSLFVELGALVLLVVLIVNWLSPRVASLTFSETEIAFLFPAPVSRRMLIHYRLLGSQLGIIFSALILTLVFGRAQGLGGNIWFHALGWWVVLATLNLHFTGTSFVYSKLLNRSLTSVRRRFIVIGIACAALIGLVAWIASTMRLPLADDFSNPQALASYATAQLHAGPFPYLLAIPELMVKPYFATSAGAFLLALIPAAIVLLANYFWVIRTEVSFEEASLARAEKRARMRTAQQGDWRGKSGARKARRAPFELRSVGRPETAFLWKNLLSTSALFRPKMALILAIGIVAFSQWPAEASLLAPFRVVGLTSAATLLVITMLLGPQIARQDIRSDLQNTDLLKTYPLRGWQIVLGELLTPLAILSALVWLCLLAAVLLLPPDQLTMLTPPLRVAAALALAVLVPPFLAIQLLVPNAAAIFFPAWMQTAGNRSERGIEVLGQRIIFLAGQLLITTFALIPAVLSAALIFFVGQWLFGFVAAAALAVAAVFALLATEAWLGVRWLGHQFEKFDLSAELRP